VSAYRSAPSRRVGRWEVQVSTGKQVVLVWLSAVPFVVALARVVVLGWNEIGPALILGSFGMTAMLAVATVVTLGMTSGKGSGR